VLHFHACDVPLYYVYVVKVQRERGVELHVVVYLNFIDEQVEVVS
jgi:predicted Co/Zn/Cd cation transporter (cation efflux family)